MAAKYFYSSNAKGIGEYVHYHYYNYEKYGINRNETNKKSESASEALAKSHAALKGIIKNNVTTTKANIVGDYLNDFFYNIRKENEKDQREWEKSWGENGELENFKKEFENSIKDQFAMLEPDAFLMDFKNKSGAQVNSSKYYYDSLMSSASQKDTVEKRVKEQTLRKLREEIDQLALKIMMIKYTTSSITNIEKLDNMFKECVEKYRAIDAIIQDYDANLAVVFRKTATGKINKNGKKIYSKPMKTALGEFLSQVNRLLKNGLSPTNRDFGTIGERSVAFALLVGNKVANNAINDTAKNLVDKIVVGNQGTATKLNRFAPTVYVNNITGEMNTYISDNEQAKKGKFYFTDSDGSVESYSTSQDTVDISIELANGSYLQQKLGIDALNASIKNVKSIDNEVKVLSGAPLIAILELASTDFINHYLNLLACFNIHSGFANDLDDYNTEVHYLSAVRALSGIRQVDNPSLTRYSDCFIVNDRSRQQVFVWGTADLLNQLEFLGERIWEVVNIKEGGMNGLPWSLANDWVENTKDNSKYNYGAAYYRISKVIAQLHQYKIYASLKLTGLKR